jgi:capsular exopolysaccharide synthesis family protein
LETIRERIWVVIGTVALTTAVAVIYLLTTPKEYEATAEMFVNPVPNDDPALVGLPLIRDSFEPTQVGETAARQVENLEVAERVRKELELEQSASEILSHITAEPIANSSTVAVSARARNPETAQDLANGFAAQTVARRTDQLHAELERRLGNLDDPATGETKQTVGAYEVLLSGPDPSLTIDTEATLPEGSVTPRPLLSLAAALLGGLVLGIAIAFALQLIDPRLRREEQLRRNYRLPILGRVPKESKAMSRPIPPNKMSPAASEAYRTLRGTLSASRRRSQGASSAILVTGSSPSEGKTTTTINLASSLAAAGNSVIVIESDLRRPAIAKTLELHPEHGVVSVLIESIRLEDALVTSEAYGSNLGFLLADYQGGWIADLFSIPAAREMIEEARRLADYVIVDSPPLTDVIDALPLASYVDDVLVVVRLGRTDLVRLRQLAELLAENRIEPAGFAVVGAPRHTGSYYYYSSLSQDGKDGDRSEIGGRRGLREGVLRG